MMTTVSLSNVSRSSESYCWNACGQGLLLKFEHATARWDRLVILKA
jgi:hypothetical protein